MTNYAALGEYTAYSEQARDAAGRRFAYAKNLSTQLRLLADRPEGGVNQQELQRAVDDIAAADREMNAALERANQSAPLCNKPLLTHRSLSKF
ncbi:hypothetical protein [Enterobacter mori]|uniref:hypothetical protein n=1 Tax=Enterobacter mori TaxID=539813 RepID=UPI003B83A8F9